MVAECALVEAAIERVKSLVSPHVPRPRAVTLGDIAVAARSTAMTTEVVGDSSGAVIAAHRRFATRNSASLRLAGRTDHGLQGQMTVAAAAAHGGVLRLDAIASQTQAMRQAGADAISPAAQRAILTALCLQLSRAKGVVDSISRQSAELAGRIQGLDYEFPCAPKPWSSRFRKDRSSGVCGHAGRSARIDALSFIPISASARTGVRPTTPTDRHETARLRRRS